MKIFLSYGHDSNAPLIKKIQDYLSKDAEGYLKHEVWMDNLKSRIYPISFKPHAELPGDMRNYYHFGEI